MIQLNLSKLSPEKKQFAWHWLKENKPEQANLLNDKAFKLAQKTFSGQVVIELEASEMEDMKKKFALVRPESV